MSRLRKLTVAALACLAWTSVAAGAFAQTCAPPPGFVDTPHPVVAPAEQLVAHVEEITIDRSLSIVLSAVDKPLKDTFHKTGSLPIVSGDYMLTKGDFGALGSRRLTCLGDGSTLEEEVLQASVTTVPIDFAMSSGTIRPRKPALSSMGSVIFTIPTWVTVAPTSLGPTHSSSRRTSSRATLELLAASSFACTSWTENTRR